MLPEKQARAEKAVTRRVVEATLPDFYKFSKLNKPNASRGGTTFYRPHNARRSAKRYLPPVFEARKSAKIVHPRPKAFYPSITSSEARNDPRITSFS